MRVLMLGWEYPPHISGGLGTACEGLTNALSRSGVKIHFVLPHVSGEETASHMTLVESRTGVRYQHGHATPGELFSSSYDDEVLYTAIPSLLSPYLTEQGFDDFIKYLTDFDEKGIGRALRPETLPPHVRETLLREQLLRKGSSQYGHDIFHEVNRYASDVIASVAHEEFDVIHAHDWMTFPAAVALSKLKKKPLVLHIHSLEYDRSGAHMNEQIHHVEKFGISHANAVVAVSYYTKAVIQTQHTIASEKVHVVHNGVYPRPLVQTYRRGQGWPSKVVLFLGRITFQKGPDYFVEAAAKVIEHVPDVVFVMAGSGDMLPRLVHRVQELQIEKNFHFPGFLRGEEVEEMFSIADLYVMPSVSEPFGISALEAISFDTPVILSRQSGVAEVLGHALKVDFWDVDRMADLIINALVHEELRTDMVTMAREELKRLRWDAAALKTIEVYRRVM